MNIRFETAPTGGTSVRTVEPITVGVPIPRGLCRDERSIALFDARRRRVAVQAAVTKRWPDGSIKWALLDFQRDDGAPLYTVAFDAGEGATPARRVRVNERANGVSIDTGAAHFDLRPGTLPIHGWRVGPTPIVGQSRSLLTLEDSHGRTHAAEFRRIDVEECGPLRAVVRMAGTVAAGRSDSLVVDCRLHFFAGLGIMRVDVTLHNPRRAGHPGGYWELGDAGSVLFRDVSFRLSLDEAAAGSRVAYSIAPRQDAVPGVDACHVFQASSGGEHWNSRNHVNRHGEVAHHFRGYTVLDSRGHARGERATPLAVVTRNGFWAAVGMPRFWQNFPKAMDVDAASIAVGLWPRAHDDDHELQGGEQKTHTFYLAAGTGSVDIRSLEWMRAPSCAVPDPEWCCGSGAIPWLSSDALTLDEGHRRLVDAAIDGPDSFERKREVIDEYGWRNFGDIYADHEAVGVESDQPLISHYNNQYDAVGVFAYHFLRSGDTRWWRAMDELAAHVVDIDIYHADRDKSAYNGGLFWHTCHYLDAGRSTHRSYPRSPGTAGGGPSNEHNYTTGLMLHYFMTGSRASRDAALGLARWVRGMDDGRRTVFRWVDRGRTGLASATASPDYHGPGRGAGNSIQALLNAFELSGDSSFLETAEGLIHRCIHPEDDVAQRQLLDRERRWSYTVFLQAIGRYLAVKEEHGQRDACHAYARAALLHYARWMAEHEFPYLDRPEQLEYPTETWVAQEARKSEVFDLASRYSSSEERQRFVERADFFWRYAIATLSSMPTRALTRPLVIIAGHGFLRAAMAGRRAEPVDTRSASGFAFPPPIVFRSQKARVKARLRLAATASGATALVTIARWLLT